MGNGKATRFQNRFTKKIYRQTCHTFLRSRYRPPQKCCVLIVENGYQLDTVKEIISVAGFSKLPKNMTVTTETQVINYNWMRGRRFVHIHCPRKFVRGDLLYEIVSSVGDMDLKNITFY